MIVRPDHTHDPARTSWVESANRPGGDFPVQNLPYGVFRRKGGATEVSIGVAIGDMILDLTRCAGEGMLVDLPDPVREACLARTLNPLMALSTDDRRSLRSRLSEILSSDFRAKEGITPLLVPVTDAVVLLPATIGDYTDFYASIHHATNVGRMFRPDQPLLPNYTYVPIGYHGRSSSIVVSGTGVHRPHGQVKDDSAPRPEFIACRQLDYELEVGCFTGRGNAMGEAISLASAEDHMFGVVLLNDWSARDIQKWEYVPLGPFLAKNFATTISPWVVTMEALAPFRVPLDPRSSSDPAPLPYLDDPADRAGGGIDIQLEVLLTTAAMRAAGTEPYRVSRTSFRAMYWSFGQMVTHHTGNGCPLRPGDLLGSGTVSGPDRAAQGCLLEITRRGAEPLELPGGEKRIFLQDGDEVILRGFCEREGARRIGFGSCRGTILPAT